MLYLSVHPHSLQFACYVQFKRGKVNLWIANVWIFERFASFAQPNNSESDGHWLGQIKVFTSMSQRLITRASNFHNALSQCCKQSVCCTHLHRRRRPKSNEPINLTMTSSLPPPPHHCTGILHMLHSLSAVMSSANYSNPTTHSLLGDHYSLSPWYRAPKIDPQPREVHFLTTRNKYPKDVDESNSNWNNCWQATLSPGRQSKLIPWLMRGLGFSYPLSRPVRRRRRGIYRRQLCTN